MRFHHSIHFFSDALKDDSQKVMPVAKGYDPISAAIAAHGDHLKAKVIKSNNFFGVNSVW